MSAKKISLIIFLLIIFPQFCFAGELKHIVKDSDNFINIDWDKICCQNTCLVNFLTKEEYIHFKREGKRDNVPYNMKKCMNCGLIIISCAGNDWFRYEVEED